MKQALLVLGMHRSGTSAVAGCLERLGVALGPNLLPGVAGDNERGFFEHAEVIAVHERFLAARGRAWDDPRPSLREPLTPEEERALGDALEPILARDFASSILWAVKDPRLCRLTPAWLALAERLGFAVAALVVCRPPAEVAASLARRNGFSPAKSILLWLDHGLAAERATRGVPRAFLGFDSLLADPVATLEAAGERLGLSWPRSPATVRSELSAFASPELRHHHAEEAALAGVALGDLAVELDVAQRDAAAGGEDPARFDRLAERFLARAPAFEPVFLEHLHQVAARSAADRAWQVERELETMIAAQRRTLDEDLSGWLRRLDGEVGRHGPELERLGEALERTRRELGELSGEVAGQGKAHTAERAERAAADAGLDGALRAASASLGASLAALEAGLGERDAGLRSHDAGLREAQRALDWLAGRLDALERPPRGLAGRLGAALRALRGRPAGRPGG